MTLNSILAVLTFCLWASTWLIFFRRDIRRWWKQRPAQRAKAAAERQQRIEAYAAWTRNIPPPRPRSRVPVMPVPLPEPYSAQIVPFPRAKRGARR